MEMIELFGYTCALLMGITLGLIGAGGSALTVPIMVFLFSLDAVLATTYSLFIVGLTSMFGSIKHIRSKNVVWKFVTLFGVPSILTVFISRVFIVPFLPSTLFTVSDFVVTKNIFLLLLFALLLVFASFSMIRSSTIVSDNASNVNSFKIILGGLLVGLITGLVGAGGGFLIIPVLVLWAGLPIKNASATSLMIITINSVIGFALDKHGIRRIDWERMFYFSVLAIAGIFIGIKLTEKIAGEKLKPFFGWFILAMGIFIIWNQVRA